MTNQWLVCARDVRNPILEQRAHVGIATSMARIAVLQQEYARVQQDIAETIVVLERTVPNLSMNIANLTFSIEQRRNALLKTKAEETKEETVRTEGYALACRSAYKRISRIAHPDHNYEYYGSMAVTMLEDAFAIGQALYEDMDLEGLLEVLDSLNQTYLFSISNLANQLETEVALYEEKLEALRTSEAHEIVRAFNNEETRGQIVGHFRVLAQHRVRELIGELNSME